MNSKYHYAMAIVMPLIRVLYGVEGCNCGGLAHAVVDDTNVDDNDIGSTITLANDEENKDRPERLLVICIMEYMKLMTVEQRELLYLIMEDDWCVDDYLTKDIFDGWYDLFFDRIEHDKSTYENIDPYLTSGSSHDMDCAHLKMLHPHAIQAIIDELNKRESDIASKWYAEHGKEIEAKQAQPSFSINAITSQLKPISKDPETIARMERLGRWCWCTSYDAEVMPSHRAEQEQKAKEKAELQAICQELKKFAEDHPEITAHLKGKYCGGIVNDSDPKGVIRGRRLTDDEASALHESFCTIPDFTATIPGVKPIDESRFVTKMIHKRGDKDGETKT